MTRLVVDDDVLPAIDKEGAAVKVSAVADVDVAAASATAVGVEMARVVLLEDEHVAVGS